MKVGLNKAFVLVFAMLTMLTGANIETARADVGTHYTVQPGDTMIQIAARHRVDVNELAVLNGIAWNDWVYVGQKLMIQNAGSDLSPAPEGQVADPRYTTDPRVPNPLPALPLLTQDRPVTLLPFTYARVVQDDAPVYGSALEAFNAAAPRSCRCAR